MNKRWLFGMGLVALFLACVGDCCYAKNMAVSDYFAEYAEMAANSEPENILIVQNETRPEDYGAERVIETTNHVYYLQYRTAEERDEAWKKLKLDDLIRVVPNIEFEITEDEQGGDSASGKQNYMSWGIEAMGLNYAIDAVEKKEDASNILVAVVDTGVKTSVFNTRFPEKDLDGYCLEGCEDGMDDTIGHGTHVIGTIAEGTADNVKLLMVRMSNSGSFNLTKLLTSIEYAVSQGADVINVSAGVIFDFEIENHRLAWEIAKEYIDEAEAAGAVVVATAGNTGTDGANYPASYDSAISVGAVNNELERAGFSNHNEYLDFMAPGVAVYGLNYAYTGGEGQSIMYQEDGTSMAAPHITAAVANLKSFNKDLKLLDVVSLLKMNAIDLGDEGRDDNYGYGFVNFADAEFCVSGKTCDEYGVFVGSESPEEQEETSEETSELVPVAKKALVVAQKKYIRDDKNEDKSESEPETVPYTKKDTTDDVIVYTNDKQKPAKNFVLWDKIIYVLLAIGIMVLLFIIGFIKSRKRD